VKLSISLLTDDEGSFCALIEQIRQASLKQLLTIQTSAMRAESASQISPEQAKIQEQY
jgi:hypothetical protein